MTRRSWRNVAQASASHKAASRRCSLRVWGTMLRAATCAVVGLSWLCCVEAQRMKTWVGRRPKRQVILLIDF